MQPASNVQKICKINITLLEKEAEAYGRSQILIASTFSDEWTDSFRCPSNSNIKDDVKLTFHNCQ